MSLWGFVYEGSETLPLPSIAAEERHLIEIHCYPSAFNAFGRHRSLFGDSENSSGLNLTYGDSQDLKFYTLENTQRYRADSRVLSIILLISKHFVNSSVL